MKLYRHHYLSILIIIITGTILDLVFQNLQNDFKNNIFLFLLRLLREILNSLHNVINKYLIEKKYCSIYEIALSIGIINIILLIIFSIFDYFFFRLDKFEEYFPNFNLIEFLICLGIIITQLGLCICNLITNKNYTPCHIFIISVFGQLAIYLSFSSDSIFAFVCLVFILFWSLIFNEIIEINCFGFSDNTKRNIINRAKNEDLIIDKIDTFDENDDNEEKEKDENQNEAQGYI